MNKILFEHNNNCITFFIISDVDSSNIIPHKNSSKCLSFIMVLSKKTPSTTYSSSLFDRARDDKNSLNVLELFSLSSKKLDYLFKFQDDILISVYFLKFNTYLSII